MGLIGTLSNNVIQHDNTQHKHLLSLSWVSHFYILCEECGYAECRYAECRYAECRGATHLTIKIGGL